MAGFLETLDRIQIEQSQVHSLFTPGNSDGVPARPSARRKNNPQYRKNLLEATKLLSDVFSGARPLWQLQEVMTSDDFPILFGDILDRSVLAAYTEWPVKWTDVAKRVVLRDFRDAKIYPPIWGADGPLDQVKEAAPYPNVPVYEQEPILWHLDKYGRQIPISWETMINDDLDMFKDFPERLGRAARRTEDWSVVNLYVSSSGPKAALYDSTLYHNVVNQANGALANNPPLTIAGLQDAYTVLNSMFDEGGFPILRENVTLIVPPALEVTARNILNATQIWANTVSAGGVPDNGSGSGHQTLNAINWMRNNLTLVVNPYIPMIDTTHDATAWYLFANPSYSREALRIGFLRGHETPEIWMKSPNAQRVGGGAISPMDGDFDTDSIQYRVRHVLAFAQIDPKATVASNGSGS